MNTASYRCQSCGVVGLGESLWLLTARQNQIAWQFILFNYDRRPTIICTGCFAGYDFALLSSKLKRVPDHKVNKLMSEALFFVGRAQARGEQPDAQLLRVLTSWAE